MALGEITQDTQDLDGGVALTDSMNNLRKKVNRIAFEIADKYLEADTTVNVDSSMTDVEINAVIDAVPKNLNGYTLTVQFADGSYDLLQSHILVSGFSNGYVIMNGNPAESAIRHETQAVHINLPANTANQAFLVNRCSDARVQFKNIKVTLKNYTGGFGFRIEDGVDAYIAGCYIIGYASSTLGFGVYTTRGNVTVSQSLVEKLYYAVYNSGGTCSIENCTTASSGIESKYGIATYYAGVTSISGSVSIGGTLADTVEQYGGISNFTKNISDTLVDSTTSVPSEHTVKEYVDNAVVTGRSSTNAVALYAKDTVYQNTSDRKLMVVAMFQDSNDLQMSVYSGATSTPTTLIARSIIVSDGSHASYDTCTFIIPPGYYFKMVSDGWGNDSAVVRAEGWEI